MKISIIMPMYNAKKTVIYSANSVLLQDYPDLELLMVDDCSTDDTVEVVSEYFKDDSRVRVIRQEKNMGPAAARNRGIKEAKGKYITFVDSDDGMVGNGLRILAEAAEEYDADIVHTIGYFIPVEAPTRDDIMAVPKEKLLRYVSDADAPERPLLLTKDMGERIQSVKKGKFNGNVWGKLFRADFLREHHIEFSNLRMSEDTIFALECMLKAQTYVQIPECIILYRTFGDSLSRGNKNPAFFTKILDATIGGNILIEEKLRDIPWLREKPAELNSFLSFVSETMENIYIRPTYGIVGRCELEDDEGVNRVWSKYFKGNAEFVKKVFYDAHDVYPPVPDYFSGDVLMNECRKKLEVQNAEQKG